MKAKKNKAFYLRLNNRMSTKAHPTTARTRFWRDKLAFTQILLCFTLRKFELRLMVVGNIQLSHF